MQIILKNKRGPCGSRSQTRQPGRVIPLASDPACAYIWGVPQGAMGINALGISGSDPGAVPGGSTNILHLGIMGPKQDRRTCKGVSFASVSHHRYRCKTYSCK